MTTAADTARWIRPWYPAGVDVYETQTHGRCVIAGHLYADCEDLLYAVAEPTEGAGWLDPEEPGTCFECLSRYQKDGPAR